MSVEMKPEEIRNLSDRVNKSVYACYDKSQKSIEVSGNASCMYSASGRLVCNAVGDGTNQILNTQPFYKNCPARKQ